MGRVADILRSADRRAARRRGTGDDALRRFAELLAGASDPCPRLRRAVEQLLGVRLDYRSQLHPRVRSELDGLTLEERDPVTGEQRNRVVVEVSPDGAEQLYPFVVQMAEQAAYLTKKALLLREAVTPALVLHAAAEQFEDTVIRSGDSELEFRRLARSYKNEIWPGVFGEIDAANARFAAVVAGPRRARREPGRHGRRRPEVSDDGELVFRIGMVGPSRVGKTSLITALLRDSQRLLEGTPGVDAAASAPPPRSGSPSTAASSTGRCWPASSLPARWAARRSRSASSCCSTPACRGTGIELQLLDYPGGWLDPANRPHDRDGEWQACQRFLEQCSVLLVPIDAAVLMEATAAAHLRAVPSILTTPQVADVVRRGSSDATSARTSRRC